MYRYENEIKELINSRIAYYINSQAGNHVHKITLQTEEGSELNPNFLVKYEVADRKFEPFFINGFKQIGLSDPFPDDQVNLKESLKSEEAPFISLPSTNSVSVYPASRMIKSNSPFCIYIPRKEVMFKLMRACINVKFEHELWFN